MGGLACPPETSYGGALSTQIGPDMGGLAFLLGPFKGGLASPFGDQIWGGLFDLTGPCYGGPTGPYYGGPSFPLEPSQGPFFWA